MIYIIDVLHLDVTQHYTAPFHPLADMPPYL